MHRTALFLLVAFATGLAQAQAQTQEPPKRKSGLWEITKTSTRTGGQTRVLLWCIDEKTDNALMQLAEGGRSEKCKVDTMRREGEKLIVDATCTIGEQKIAAATHAVITGNFESAYKVESNATYAQPIRKKGEGSAVLAARWTGPCKQGQKPGDIILPSGAKFNPPSATASTAAPKSAPPKPPIGAKKRDKSTPPAYTPPSSSSPASAPPASAPPATSPPASAPPPGPAK